MRLDRAFARIERGMKKAEKYAKEAMILGMEEICKITEIEAQGRAPYKIIERSIKHDVKVEGDTITGYVGPVVERLDGTRQYVNVPWAPDTGRPIGLFWEVGFHHKIWGRPTGIYKQRPYLEPAFDFVKPHVGKLLGKRLKKAVLQARIKTVMNV